MRITSLGLALILGGMTAAACTTMDGNSADDTSAASSELGAKPAFVPSFTLYVSQDEGSVDLHNNTLNKWDISPDPNGGQFAYLAGTSITASPSFKTEPQNCVQFLRWTGDCTGATCNLIMDSDKSIHAVWGPIRGCGGN